LERRKGFIVVIISFRRNSYEKKPHTRIFQRKKYVREEEGEGGDSLFTEKPTKKEVSLMPILYFFILEEGERA